MCPKLSNPKAYMSEELYRDIVRRLRKLSEPVVGGITAPDLEKVKEAAHTALKQLGDSVPEFRQMVPAYEITCDPETGKMLCSFYMDVPCEKVRVTYHRPEDMTEEEWNKLVSEIVEEL